MLFKSSEIIKRGLTLRNAWDFFMILVALANLIFIIFDFTYLSLRPYYKVELPGITDLYDPVLGIEDHRLTHEYLQTVSDLERLTGFTQKNGAATKQTTANADEILTAKKKLIDLSARMIDENPFERAGMTGHFEKIKDNIKKYVSKGDPHAVKKVHSKDAFETFWSAEGTDLAKNIQYFNKKIKPSMYINYYRRYDYNGKLMNRSYKIDLPFLLFFLAEFLVQWFIAIRRKIYVTWYIYPIYNWYDVLSLMPFPHLRFFRLFRIIYIYNRLKRSGLTTVGEDPVTTWIKKYRNVIAAEISDLVTVKIISQIQKEIKSGTSTNTVIEAIKPKKIELRDELISLIRGLMIDIQKNKQSKRLFKESLESAAVEIPSLELFPDFVKVKLVTDIGMAIFESVMSTMINYLEEDQGRRLFEKIIDSLIDEMVDTSDTPLERTIEDIVLEVLENIKKSLSKKIK